MPTGARTGKKLYQKISRIRPRKPPRRENPPAKASVNVTAGEDKGDNTDYGGLMLCQVTAGTTVDKNPILEYQHNLSQSGGHISPTWALLENHSTMDIFSNRRLLKNIRKYDRLLAIFQQEEEQLQASRGTS